MDQMAPLIPGIKGDIVIKCTLGVLIACITAHKNIIGNGQKPTIGTKTIACGAPGAKP